ncbi:MAG: DUF1080 domain-containing protein [Rhodothermales bacterium]
MKNLYYVLTLAVLAFVATPAAGQNHDMHGMAGMEEMHKMHGYMGRWTLDIPGGAGWLNVHHKNGYLDAELLWMGGSVLPVASAYEEHGKLVVTRVNNVVKERDAMDKPLRTHQVTERYEFVLGHDELVGTAYFPAANGLSTNVVRFTGMRLPALPPAPDLAAAKKGTPINLLNGRDLTGWKIINPDHKNGFSVENGVLVNNPAQPADDPHRYHYGNLRTEQEFEDFNLKLEVNVPAGGNSGVYLRGIYEIQVVDSYGKALDPHNMGALYSRITPSMSAEKPAGEWQTMDITLYKHHVTVILNGKKIIDNAPVQGVTGGAMSADESKPGPIYLQGDHDKVMYRNIVLTPLS